MTRTNWLLLGILLVPSASSAQSVELERAIRVEGERSGCVTARALRERIGSYLGSTSRPPELEVAVDLGREPASFRLRLGDAVVAERRFDRLPPACAERRDAIALAVAVAIEHALPPRKVGDDRSSSTPRAAGTGEVATREASTRDATREGASRDAVAARESAVAREAAATREAAARESAAAREAAAREVAARESAAALEPDDPPESDVSSTSDLAEPDPARAADATTPRSISRWQVFGGAAYVLQVATRPLVAFTLGAEFAPTSLLRIHVSAFATPNAAEQLAGGTVSSRAAGGHALACIYSPLAGTLAQACAGAGAGIVHAQGTGFDDNLDDDMAWAAGIARIAVEVPSQSRLAVRVALDARVNLLRPELRVASDVGQDATQDTRYFGASIGGELIVRLD